MIQPCPIIKNFYGKKITVFNATVVVYHTRPCTVDLTGAIGSGGIMKDPPNRIPQCLVQHGLRMAAWLCMETAEFCVLSSDFQLIIVRMKIRIKLLLASPQFLTQKAHITVIYDSMYECYMNIVTVII